MTYQLWDTVAGSAVGVFASEKQAMEIVRSSFDQHGPDEVMDLILFAVDESRTMHHIADGQELIERVTQFAHA